MKTLIIALKIFLFFTVLTGIIYPLFITGIAQVAFSKKANGSLIHEGNRVVGSELIGQQFDSTIYFTGRPSAILYNPLPSCGSNYGLTNAKLITLVEERKSYFIAFNGLDSLSEVPSDMLFASGSGLDPHIPVQAALQQVDRIVKSRNFTTIQKEELLACIKKTTQSPQFLVFRQERLNVLALNIELDKIERNQSNLFNN
jgi:K+-transporting ATPase ATPase C chain